ncbi:MAG: LacI family DNA-binding transcriptional regulator [Pseudomonadota bacterium]
MMDDQTPDTRRSQERGPRRVRMVDVARQAGVALVTVSRVLHVPEKVAPETRARVEQVIRETGYVPNLVARSLVAARTRIVAALIPTIDNSLHADIVQAVDEHCRASGLHLVLGCTNFTLDNEEEMVRSLLAHQPEAIYLTGITHSPATRAMLASAAIPVVEASNLPEEPIDMAVGYSNAAATEALVQMLIETGRRRIALVYAPIASNDRQIDRRRAYQGTLEAAGIATDPALVVEADLTIAGGAAAMRMLLDRKVEMDAVFCSSDVLAVGALMECQRQGIKVPDQLALAGFDDLPIAAELVPALTTVRVPRRRIGEEAARLILARLEGHPLEQRVIDTGFEIVRRQSA